MSSNFSRGGAGGPRRHQATARPQVRKVVGNSVDKGMGPMNSRLMPIQTNAAAERGGPVGGLGDADRMARMGRVNHASTARRGGTSAALGNQEAGRTMDTGMKGTTPYPGQRGRAPAMPAAPRNLQQADEGIGTTSMSAESGAPAFARLKRGGGRVSGAVRHNPPGLPRPVPSFPKADNPGGGPQPEVRQRGGWMAGTWQGGRGQVGQGGARMNPPRPMGRQPRGM